MKTAKILFLLFIAISSFSFGQKKKKTIPPPPIVKKEKKIPPPSVKEFENTFNHDFFIWRLDKDTILPAESPYEIVLQVNDYSAFLRVNSYPETVSHRVIRDTVDDSRIIARTMLTQSSNYDVEIKNNILELRDRKTNQVKQFKIIKKNNKIIQLQDVDSKLIYNKDDDYTYSPPPSI
ncbi:hypothetical protein [Empedobacter brevis]|uniref:hypothetical protein n=1 Tax=Empedobacter brevis TaxID=247 RepID=UPI0028A0282B|nr:hypothetical protein [Empedobacter brevis]